MTVLGDGVGEVGGTVRGGLLAGRLLRVGAGGVARRLAGLGDQALAERAEDTGRGRVRVGEQLAVLVGLEGEGARALSSAQGRANVSRASYGDLPSFWTCSGLLSVAVRAPMTMDVELASLGPPGV